jgi:hypothetical protein
LTGAATPYSPDGRKEKVLFGGEPLRMNTEGPVPVFENLPGKDKHLDGKHIRVSGSLVVDPHESQRLRREGSRCGLQGCLELHPVSTIILLNEPAK